MQIRAAPTRFSDVLGSTVVPCCPFWFGVSLLKPHTLNPKPLIIKGATGEPSLGFLASGPVFRGLGL